MCVKSQGWECVLEDCKEVCVCVVRRECVIKISCREGVARRGMYQRLSDTHLCNYRSVNPRYTK